MPRFFKENFKAEPFIEGNDAKHISKSLRIREGETLTVCDGKGTDFLCAVKDVTKDRVDLEILSESESQSEPDISLTLCTCLLKGDKFEQVIKHGVELGVTSFIPVLSENCVSRPDEKSIIGKLCRWQKIALEAAGQSGRGALPKVMPVMTLEALGEKISQFDLTLFCYEAGGKPLGETFWENDGAKNIAVITGPEGGFSEKEAEALEKAGAKVVTLGKRILRAETAPLAAVTAVMLLTDNLE